MRGHACWRRTLMKTRSMTIVSSSSVAIIAIAALLTSTTGAGCRDRNRTPTFERDQPPTTQEQSERERERESQNPNEQDKSGTTMITGAQLVANEAAVDKIVASRCARRNDVRQHWTRQAFPDG